MDAHVDRLDFIYEEVFARPVFSRAASFVQILEPIYDAFAGADITIPADALRVESGNSIDTAKVTLSLLSGFQKFEARLDGFKAHFLDLRTPQAAEQARQLARLFGTAVCEFLSEGISGHTTITSATWLTIDGGYDAADGLVHNTVWKTDSTDPFRIGAQTVTSLARFDCTNPDEHWIASVAIARSQLPGSHLFLQVAAEYRQGSGPEDFADRVGHVREVWDSVAGSLGLTVS